PCPGPPCLWSWVPLVPGAVSRPRIGRRPGRRSGPVPGPRHSTFSCSFLPGVKSDQWGSLSLPLCTLHEKSEKYFNGTDHSSRYLLGRDHPEKECAIGMPGVAAAVATLEHLV